MLNEESAKLNCQHYKGSFKFARFILFIKAAGK